MKSRLHKTGTSDTYESHLRNHILSVFGKYGLAAVKPTMVQHWVKELQSVTGLAPATIETIYVIFASIMRGAVRDGYIRKTPCGDIRLPEVVATVMRLLTPVQMLTLADAMPRRYAPLVLLGAIVDRRPVLAHPKASASVRDVPMAAFLRDALLDHSKQLRLTGDDVLCRTPRQTLPRRDYYNREIWKPALAAAGLPADATLVPEASGRARDALDRAFTRR